MRISRTRQFKANMSQYEHFQFGATVTLDHNDLGYTDDEARKMDHTDLAAEINEAVMTLLDNYLGTEIEEARELTQAEQTFLLDSFTNNNRRSRRNRRK